MQRFEYAVSVIQTEGRYTVRCRDLPQLKATSDDMASSIGLAEERIECTFSDYMLAGKELPTPSKPVEGEHLVTPTAETTAKAALHAAMRDTGITKVQLARRLDVDEKEVRLMLDPHYKSKLSKISRSIAVLGRRLVIRMELN